MTQITNSQWNTNKYQADNGSISTFQNGIFNGTIIKSSITDYGNVDIRQGIQPHNWFKGTYRLLETLTITPVINKLLFFNIDIKRVGDITWLSPDTNIRANSIGIDLYGDSGLDYNNPDITNPHALIVDFYLDRNQSGIDLKKPYHYQGDSSSQDYHSQYHIHPFQFTSYNTYFNYSFRIDQYIRDALRYWNLPYFTINFCEVYIEGRASQGSVEAKNISMTDAGTIETAYTIIRNRSSKLDY